MVIEPLLSSASRKRTTRRVDIGGVVIGGDAVPVIAGPCAVEAEYVAHADAAARAGASALRGCVLKPRTHAHSFQGLGALGLRLLDEARERTGLPIVAEPLGVADIEMLRGHADVMMIGARSMQNTPLLRAAGRSGMPVLLKRGMSATYDEWLAAAGYITGEGNTDVILCERGIRTFETATRNTCDITAVPVLQELTHLPVILDPSHATGKRSLVPPLSRAGVAIGADGLIVEVHPCPEKAVSDGAQSLTLPDFDRMMRELKPYVRLWKESRAVAAEAVA